MARSRVVEVNVDKDDHAHCRWHEKHRALFEQRRHA